MVQIKFDKELVLAQHFLLKHLDREYLRHLAQSATLASFPRNRTIFQKGDPGDSMMAVIRGRVKICTHSADGKELVLNIIGNGGLFGEIALLDGEPRTADAVALDETDLLVLSRAQFLPTMTARPDMALRLIAVLCKRLRLTSEHLEDALLLDVPSRVARALLRLAEAFGRPAGDAVRIDIKLSQQQIGTLVGISRESVNKQLVDWQRDGMISVESGLITLLDGEGLRAVAASAM